MPIDKNNYEDFFLRYVDGELDAADQRAVEAFAASFPDLGQELEWLRQTVSVAPPTAFEHKDMLYREEKRDRVIAWYYWRAAAVTAVLLAGAAWYFAGSHASRQEQAATLATAQPAKTVPAKTGGEATTAVVPETATANGKSPVLKAVSTANQGMAKTTGRAPAGKTQRKVIAPPPTVGGATARQQSANVASLRADAPQQKPAVPDIVPAGDQAGTAVNPSATNDVVGQAAEKQAVPGRPTAPVVVTADKTPLPAAAVAATGVTAATTVRRPRVTATPAVVPEVDVTPVETASTSGDEAISILPFDQRRSVRKFFRRLSGKKKEADDVAENTGGRDINISVFRFALSKKSTD